MLLLLGQCYFTICERLSVQKERITFYLLSFSFLGTAPTVLTKTKTKKGDGLSVFGRTPFFRLGSIITKEQMRRSAFYVGEKPPTLSG